MRRYLKYQESYATEYARLFSEHVYFTRQRTLTILPQNKDTLNEVRVYIPCFEIKSNRNNKVIIANIECILLVHKPLNVLDCLPQPKSEHI